MAYGSYPTPVAPMQTNPNPFYLKLITGNIRTCQGCKESLKCADALIPEPPHQYTHCPCGEMAISGCIWKSSDT